MKSIVMDTSNKYLVIGLYDNDHQLSSYNEKGNQKQSEYALVELKRLLDNNHLSMLDIDEMIITRGPGSYTGQRVALTIAKTLAATTDIKIKVVSSLQSYVGDKDGISILDARSNKMFLGIYKDQKPLIDECLINISEFESYKNKYKDFNVYGDLELINGKSEEVDLVNNIYCLSKLTDYVKDVDSLVPMYLKDVEAKKL